MIRRFIILLLSLNILFSNIAWAVDECAFDNDAIHQELIPLEGHHANVYLFDASSDDTCDTFCIGWAQLLSVSYKMASVNFDITHSPIKSSFFHYYTLKSSPLIEPPKV